MVAVSYLTAEPDYAKIQSLTFGTTTAEDRKKTSASWSMNEVWPAPWCWPASWAAICTSAARVPSADKGERQLAQTERRSATTRAKLAIPRGLSPCRTNQ